jgi:hypothetical protein
MVMSVDELEKAFRSTSEIILGKKLQDPQSYRPWLFENVLEATRMKSKLSGKTIYVPTLIFFKLIKNMITLEESVQMAEKKLPLSELDHLTLANAAEKLKGINYLTSDVKLGQNEDVRECDTYMNARHCLDGIFYIYAKYDAYCFWPRETEYSFGCHYTLASKFCMKCYYSVNLTRCFEVSDSTNCADCYFSHNLENCSNCLFCFNVKSLRYAIGNVEVGKEKFMEIKAKLLAEITATLEKKKRLDLNIYNLGCWKK